MEQLHEAGDVEGLSAAVKSAASTKIKIKSMKASYSIFDFSTKKRTVIVKIVYSIDDATGTREAGTKYYAFDHSPLVNTWNLPRERSALSYYLNFL